MKILHRGVVRYSRLKVGYNQQNVGLTKVLIVTNSPLHSVIYVPYMLIMMIMYEQHLLYGLIAKFYFRVLGSLICKTLKVIGQAIFVYNCIIKKCISQYSTALHVYLH